MTDDNSIYGVLSVRLRHPSIPVTEVSRLIGIPTTTEWSAVDLLHRGSALPSRQRGENYWASDVVLREREFGTAFLDAVEALRRHHKRLVAFTSNGGKLELYLQFNGQVNVGDSLTPDLLRSLGELGAELQIEVFPIFNP